VDGNAGGALVQGMHHHHQQQLPPPQPPPQPPQQQAGLRIPPDPLPDMGNMFAAAAAAGFGPGGLPPRPASPAVDDWEIDISQLSIDAKVASGAFSNLYRGSYCGQEVAVKILKDVADDTSQYQEFLQVCVCVSFVR
jgi:hypothetical protein